MNGAKILAGIAGSIWCITQTKLDQIMEVIEQRALHEKKSDEEIRAALGGIDDFTRENHRSDTKTGGVAVLSLTGSIFPKANMVTRYSGGTSTQQFGSIFQEAMEDPQIKTIVLDIDSPGGSVYGVEELGNTIYQARGKKPIVAVANHMAASAAYWIGTAADEFYVSPSGEVGSVGAIAVHIDESKRLEKQGFKVTMVRAGENKARFNSVEPLEAETLSKLQEAVDGYRDTFVSNVLRNRAGSSVKPPHDLGAGDMFSAEKAVRLGLADGVMPLEFIVNQAVERNHTQSRLLRARAQVAAASLEVAGE